MNAFLSALNQPKATFGGQDLYPTVYDKAAAYLFFIAEAQAFLNGNKRVAIGVALDFLAMNGIRLNRAAADGPLKKALLDLGEKRISHKDLPGILQSLN
jgi:death on curing protein